jgi:2-oxoisovalerate dehydrogenase E1 component
MTDADGLRDMFATMATIRACDERIRRGLSSGEFAFTYWPCSGQEAVAVGAASALRPDDRIVSTYRGLHDQLAKGAPLDAVVAELLCRSTGINAGKGGAMHVSDPASGVVLSTGIVGAGIPVANGLALSSLLRRDGRVTVAAFGDGATNTGAFHEAVNLAAVWRLPVVFLCQNNGYGEMTPVAHTQVLTHVAERAPGYGIPGVTVDGNDPRAVQHAVADAAARARRGDGPTLVECVTYRLHGHYFGDPMAYMPPDELEAARANHPVDRFRRSLVSDGVLSEDEASKLEEEAATRVETAFAEALAAPLPEPAEAVVDVYGPPAAAPPPPGATTTNRSLRVAINLALDEALGSDERVVLLGEDLADPAGGALGTTRGLSTKYGADRVRDTPISETAIAGAAIGAAMAGLLPVAEIMIMDFIGICLDQLVNLAAKSRYMSGGKLQVPLTVRTAVFGGLLSGATHSQTFEAWLMHVPGLKVVMPSTPADAKGLLTSCIFDEDPCVFVENVSLYASSGPVPDGSYAIPLGVADVKREGSDATVVTYGRTVRDALAAADELAAEGVAVEVVDLRTLLPLDTDTVLRSVAKTRRAVVAHHATAFAGPGAEIASTIGAELFGDLEAPVRRVGARFAPIGSAPTLEAAVMPSAADIAAAVRSTLRSA